MRRATELDGLLDGERPMSRTVLLGQREPSRHLTRAQLPRSLPLEQHHTINRALEARKRAQQCGFARAVRTDQRQHLTGSCAEAHLLDHPLIAELAGQVARFNQLAHCRPRPSSHRKHGPPTSAVMIPTGSSSGAATLRAALSASNNSSAPDSAATGINRAWPVPTSERAMCGAISPTNPTIPLAATAAAVTRLAATTIAARAWPSGR